MRNAIDRMLNRTFDEILGGEGTNELIFLDKDGNGFKMYHEQDCCEHVYIEDIIGDLPDLLNTPILEASENTEEDPNDSCGNWTFYRFSTIKGTVTVRWYGSSEYYSTSVDIREL